MWLLTDENHEDLNLGQNFSQLLESSYISQFSVDAETIGKRKSVPKRHQRVTEGPIYAFSQHGRSADCSQVKIYISEIPLKIPAPGKSTRHPMETNPCKQNRELASIPSQSSEILSMLKDISISRLLTHHFDPGSTVGLNGWKVSQPAALQSTHDQTKLQILLNKL